MDALWTSAFGKIFNETVQSEFEFGLHYVAALRWSYSAPKHWLLQLEAGSKAPTLMRKIRRSYVRHNLRRYAGMLEKDLMEDDHSDDVFDVSRVYHECAIVTSTTINQLSVYFSNRPLDESSDQYPIAPVATAM